MKLFLAALPLERAGIPAVLALVVASSARAQLGHVVGARKISETSGGFEGELDEQDQFGRSIVDLGDLNGDGTSDLLVGSHTDDDGPGGGLDRGSVWILFLAPNGFCLGQQKLSEGNGGFGGHLDPNDQFGRAACKVGDLDDDGFLEVAVSSNYDDDGGTNNGAIYILSLNPDGTVRRVQKISETSGGFGGTLNIHDEFGRSLAPLGDLDGDGVEDLFAGAPGNDIGGYQTGAAYVLFLNADGTVKGHHPINKQTEGLTLRSGDWFGFSAASLGDLDGDGSTDVAVGGVLDDDGGINQGAVWILSLRPDGRVKSSVEINELSGGLNVALDDIDHFGTSLANIGDLDKDGVTDIAVGAVKDDDGGAAGDPDADVGAVYVLFLEPDGSVESAVKLSDLAGDFPYNLDAGDWFGSALAPMGGSPLDGLYNLVIGARFDNDGGGNNGAVYLVQLNDGTAPVARFSADPSFGSGPLAVQFTDESSGEITAWLWSFSDGPSSSQRNPVHTFSAPGNYTIRLDVRGPQGLDQLVRADFVTVTGPGFPSASFGADPTSGVAPLQVAFADSSSGEVTGWSWDFGDGASSSDRHPVHVYAEPGSYTVTLVASGPMGSDPLVLADYILVSSGPAPVADFTASAENGEPPLAVDFRDLSVGPVTAWYWDFGDGTSSDQRHPSHVYTEVGVYTVALTVTGPGGSDTLTVEDLVTVNEPSPVAAFGASPASGPAPLSVAFTDQSALHVTSWSWDFGDGAGSGAADPVHVYANPGLYTVSLTVTSAGGSDSLTRADLISVVEPPLAADFAAAPTSGAPPLAVSFTDLSSGNVTGWSWDFGDGVCSSAPDPVHVYTSPGLYDVTLTVNGPGGSDAEQRTGYIELLEAPAFSDGGFEQQTPGTAPVAPWQVFGGTSLSIEPGGPPAQPSDGEMPTEGANWCEIGAEGSVDARPPSNPGGVGQAPLGAAVLGQVFRFDPARPQLLFDAAFLLGGPVASSLQNDFMSVDLSYGSSAWNVFYADTFSDFPQVSAKHGLPMTEVQRTLVDLRELFPLATSDTVLMLQIAVGNGGAGLQHSRGYVDAFELAPSASAVLRNGSGINASRYLSEPPFLGGPWRVQVDSTGHAGATVVYLLAHEAPASGQFFAGGEVLVGGPRLLRLTWPSSGGVDHRSFALPPDPALAGLFVATQAILLGGSVDLCNACDLTLGF